MKSIFYRFFKLAIELIAGLPGIVVIAILALPNIFCITSLLQGTHAIRVFSVLTLMAALSACNGCSSKNPSEPSRVVHWKGQDSGCEDETTVQPGDNASITCKH